jgi:hypothetical protein
MAKNENNLYVTSQLLVLCERQKRHSLTRNSDLIMGFFGSKSSQIVVFCKYLPMMTPAESELRSAKTSAEFWLAGQPE